MLFEQADNPPALRPQASEDHHVEAASMLGEPMLTVFGEGCRGNASDLS